jgi:hypothetical protein
MADFDPTTEPDPSRPGCEAGQAALQRLLDGEPAWDAPEAAAHREQCADCREELTLARSLARLPADAVVPPGLADRVVHRSMAARRRRQFVRYAGVGVALAASVLAAVLVIRPGPEPGPEPAPTVALVPPDPEPNPPTAPTRPLGEAVGEVRDALVQLTSRTANGPRERIGPLLPAPRMPGGPDTTDDLRPLADARTGAARSVEPIAESARRAVNFFLRAADPPDRASQP